MKIFFFTMAFLAWPGAPSPHSPHFLFFLYSISSCSSIRYWVPQSLGTCHFLLLAPLLCLAFPLSSFKPLSKLQLLRDAFPRIFSLNSIPCHSSLGLFSLFLQSTSNIWNYLTHVFIIYYSSMNINSMRAGVFIFEYISANGRMPVGA